MPYANNQGVRIYYEVEGQGPPLVLMHGGTDALEVFRMVGYVDALQSDYRLIMIDTRGHGASDKPHDPELYRLKLMSGDVVAVLDDLAIRKAHFLGYSMGAGIGWGIAKYVPGRFLSLILGGGGPPYERDPSEPNFFLDLFKQRMDVVADTVQPMWGSRWTPELEDLLRANDLEALIALTSAPEWVGGVSGLVDALPNVTLPCLLFVGEDDGAYAGAKEAAGKMPNVLSSRSRAWITSKCCSAATWCCPTSAGFWRR